jgi:aconitate hydratase
MNRNSFGTLETRTVAGTEFQLYRLPALEEKGEAEVSRLPITIKLLLEAALRAEDGIGITADDISNIAGWRADLVQAPEIPFKPARVVLQDFTGVPSVVDLAAMRDAMHQLGGDPSLINPLVPVDLIIDHSVQVDTFGSPAAFMLNSKLEFQRNRERYEFLRWGQKALDRFRVVPPATGIIHQVNLEYLAKVVLTDPANGGAPPLAYPDTLVGTDSHTTMINGIGVLGWGVGGIEAEAVMLGQAISMLLPSVVGFRLSGRLPEGATATDLVLTITQQLRKHGVVGKFVEFFGPGLDHLTLPDRATISNMAPEYGATCGFFPVDSETLRYLQLSGRDEGLVRLVEAYAKEQGLFRENQVPEFSEVLELDMSTVEPSLAGPKRPQDRIPLAQMKPAFLKSMEKEHGVSPSAPGAQVVTEGPVELFPDSEVAVEMDGKTFSLTHGSVVIASITSCTNTSNPSVMLGAGILAKKAVDRGLAVKPWVKTSLAPGSRVVTAYLEKAGLMESMEELRFHLVGYGCATCIGNSGPLPEPISAAIRDNNLVTAAVLSGNRNFEGRVSPDTKVNFLASPPLVVAYALAGRVDIDFATEPIGNDPDGRPVFLKDIWPSPEEIKAAITRGVTPGLFKEQYEGIFTGSEEWNKIRVEGGKIFEWDADSTYIQNPPFFEDLAAVEPPVQSITGARVLAKLGDSVTTDHISPAGVIPRESPAGRYLEQKGVEPRDFNSYGSRRGNHEVMMRGTFANIRIRNELVPGVEGGYTLHIPSEEEMSIFDASERYREEGVPLIILAGKEYGTGSSRDWAAKGPQLLGVRAVIAESYERIHRSNLIGMGVLPLQFQTGENRESLGLTGRETYDILGLDDEIRPSQLLEVRVHPENGQPERSFKVVCRIDTPLEAIYYRNGGILHTVLRNLYRASRNPGVGSE